MPRPCASRSRPCSTASRTSSGRRTSSAPNRDVRFSADKSPYKDHQGALATTVPGMGYYVQVAAERADPPVAASTPRAPTSCPGCGRRSTSRHPGRPSSGSSRTVREAGLRARRRPGRHPAPGRAGRPPAVRADAVQEPRRPARARRAGVAVDPGRRRARARGLARGATARRVAHRARRPDAAAPHPLSRPGARVTTPRPFRTAAGTPTVEAGPRGGAAWPRAARDRITHPPDARRHGLPRRGARRAPPGRRARRRRPHP